jgi:hypothetical protein
LSGATVEHEAQLAWERRLGRVAAAAAFLSAAIFVSSVILRNAVALESRPDNEREFLLAVDEHRDAFMASAITYAVSVLVLAVVLWYLFRATRHRRPELPPWTIYLVYAGPVLFAIAQVLIELDRIDIADQFTASGVTAGRPGEMRAEDLLDERSAGPIAFGFGGTLAVALSFVLISVNAMRAGLLSRFLGIIGVIVGALYVIPIFGGPLIVQIFWLGAVGAIFLGYWPGGRGPAWESGRAERWPTYAEQRGLARDAEPERETDPEPQASEAAEQGGRPASRKRKRKRRR